MNLWRRQQSTKTSGTIGHFCLDDWWNTSFTEQERTYIDACYQPWGEQPHSLTQGFPVSTRKTLAAQLSEITCYLRHPEDIHLVRRILDKAEQEAIAQGDIQGLDAVYTALMSALYRMGSNERYYTSMARKMRTRWH